MEDDPFLCRPCDTTKKKMRYDKNYLDKYIIVTQLINYI